MIFDYFSALPISQQLTLRLRGEILSGIYAPGAPFPTVRQIACDCAINPNTVQRALSQLESEGLLITNSTTGRNLTPDEGVLTAAREAVQTEFLQTMLNQSDRLAIKPDAVIAFFEKAKNSSANTEKKEEEQL